MGRDTAYRQIFMFRKNIMSSPKAVVMLYQCQQNLVNTSGGVFAGPSTKFDWHRLISFRDEIPRPHLYALILWNLCKEGLYERTLLMCVGYSSYKVGFLRDQPKTKLTFWKLKWIYIVYEHSFLSSQRTHCTSLRKFVGECCMKRQSLSIISIMWNT
jgi:hypothetical protein